MLTLVIRTIGCGRDLALGNQVLADHLPDYRSDAKTDRERYTVAAIYEALTGIGARAPSGDETDPRSVFASFLVLDALVGNTDRHHENWGVLVGPSANAPPMLAASFDHASSLGFQLSDSHRTSLVEAREGEQTLLGYAKRGVSRHFAGKPLLLDVAAESVRAAGGASCLDALQEVQVSDAEGRVTGCFNVRGVRYVDDAHDVIDGLSVGDQLNVAPEPDNPFDPDAVIVAEDGRQLGWVPAFLTPLIHEPLNAFGEVGIRLTVQRIGERDGPVHQRLLCRLTVRWPSVAPPFSGPEFELAARTD